MNEFLKNLFKKTFYIDLEDALVYPSSQIICKYIQKYCIDNKHELEFRNTVTPVTFTLDGVLYDATVKMARGGYYIHCKEL